MNRLASLFIFGVQASEGENSSGQTSYEECPSDFEGERPWGGFRKENTAGWGFGGVNTRINPRLRVKLATNQK